MVVWSVLIGEGVCIFSIDPPLPSHDALDILLMKKRRIGQDGNVERKDVVLFTCQ
jgi:hypothetical protein